MHTADLCCVACISTTAVQRQDALERTIPVAAAAFRLTADEISLTAAAGSNWNKQQLQQDVPAVEIRVLDFFRVCTFRITCTLAFGLPIDFMDHAKALSVVRKVGAYFKVSRYSRWMQAAV